MAATIFTVRLHMRPVQLLLKHHWCVSQAQSDGYKDSCLSLRWWTVEENLSWEVSFHLPQHTMVIMTNAPLEG